MNRPSILNRSIATRLSKKLSALGFGPKSSPIRPLILSAAISTLLGGFDAHAAVVTANETLAGNGWTLPTGTNLLVGAGTTPATVTSHDGSPTTWTPTLTDGVLGAPNALTLSVTPNNGESVTFSLDLSGAAAGGYSLTSWDSYCAWQDAGRDNQNYTIQYATVAAPTTFITLTTVANGGALNSTHTKLTDSTGLLGVTNVGYIRINFAGQENGYTGFREFIALGAVTTPDITWTGASGAGGNATWISGADSNWKKTNDGTPQNYGSGGALLFDSTGANSNITVQGGGVSALSMSFTNDETVAYTFSGGSISTALVSATGAGNVTINSAVQGNGGVFKSGAGTLTLAGTNAYSGVTTFGGGIVNVGSLSNYGVASSLGNRFMDSGANGSGTASVGLLFLGGTLQYTGATAQSTNRQIRIGIAGGTIDASGSSPSATLSFTYTGTNTDLFDTGGTRTLTLTGSNTGDNTFAINLINQAANATSLLKTGAGKWILSGAGHNYTGATTVREGTLVLSGNRTVTSGGITVGDTGGTDATLNITNGTYTVGGVITLGNQVNTSTINQTGGSLTLSGTQLIVGNGLAAGSIGIYNLSAGTLTGAASTTRGVILGTNTGNTGTFNLSGTGNLAMGTANMQVGRSDSGATNSTGIFNQTGGTASIGTLTIGGSTGALNAGTSGTLNLTGGTFSASNIQFLAAADSSTANITIGGTAQVTLPAFPTARGSGATSTITFDGGTLTPFAASTAYIGNLTNAFLTANGAKFDVPTGRDITVSQALENAPAQTGTLTKLGTGTLTLAGANTYTGTTTVSAGSLAFAGASMASSISVADNATLGAKVTDVGTSALTSTANLTFGTSGISNFAVDFNLLGNPTVPVVNLGSSVLTLNGTPFVSLANTTALTTTPNNTTVALMTYGSKAGSGAFSLATTSVGHTSFALNDTATALYLSITANPVTWTGALSNLWNDDTLANPKNWVVAGPTTTDFINGDVVNFTNAGSNFAVVLTENVNPGTVTFTNTTNAYTFSSAGGVGITGSGSLTLNGSGSVTINTANSYSGGTTINAGTLVLNNATAIGTGSLTINAGTLNTTIPTVITANNVQNWNGDFTFTGTADLDMGTGAVTIAGAGTDRIVTVNAGTLSVGEIKAAAHGFSKQGAGTLALSSVGNDPTGSSIAGTLNVDAGTLQINRTGAIVATSGDFGALGLTGSGTITNGAATERLLYLHVTDAFDFAGTLADGSTGPLGLNKLDSGTQTLSGTGSTYTGQTIFGGGILSVATLADYGLPSSVGARTAAQDVATNIGLRFSGGTLQYTGATAQSTNRQIRISTVGGGTIDASGSVPSATLSFTHSGANADLYENPGARSLTLTGTNTGANTFAISLTDQDANIGKTSLTKNGPGKWVLSGTSTHTGATNVDDGTLSLTGSLGATAITVIATFDETSTGVITGAASLINFGTTTLAGNNTYTGATGVFGGTVTLANANAVQGSTVVIDVENGVIFNSGIGTFNLGGLSGSANQTLLDTGTNPVTLSVGANNGDTAYSGILSGAGGALTKVGTGTLTLSGTNTYTGPTTVNAGTLAFAVSETLSSLTIADGATVVLLAAAPAASGFGEEALTDPGPGAEAGGINGVGAASNFGDASQVSAVPEPGSLALLAFGALGLCRRRRES